MGVGADDEACTAIHEMSEALFLAGRLGVKIEDDGIRLFLQRAGSKNAFSRLEGVVQLRMHEDPPHDVGDQYACAVAGIKNARALARRTLGVIGGPQELVMALAEGNRLFLIPDVIAGGDNIGTGIDGLEIDILGDTETTSSILTVDDDEIQLQIGNQPRQSLPDSRPVLPTMSPRKRSLIHPPRSCACFDISSPLTGNQSFKKC